jgi:gamma-glutamyl:cysteine ligase YbdK (ATP-grasp superfamily)
MGQFFDKDSFSLNDHDEFRKRLHEQIETLKHLLEQVQFSSGDTTLGAELEMYLVDKDFFPTPRNTQLLSMMNHPLLTEELNKFNLEFNLSPVSAKGAPFTAMTNEVAPFLSKLKKAASSIDTKIATIGILPTLGKAHLHKSYMTDLPRYRAITKELSSLKGEPFMVNIHGKDSLKMHCDEVTLEGANTSFQVHLKVPADRFANLYNATQLSTPLVLALAGNSPIFLGHKLWHETRVALFKQSIDSRIQGLTKWRQPARVCFGHGWVRHGAWELFAENVALYKPITPYVSPKRGAFDELNLHHGTIWSWNRAVFEPNHGGHLRIEYRTLPAGPTMIDMMANAALGIGLTQALSHQMPELLSKMPFEYAHYNFYRAAQDGLDAKILWPTAGQNSLKEHFISDVIKQVLPMAIDGLQEIGVDNKEIDRLMQVIEDRLATRQTGSVWQLNHLRKLEDILDKPQALKQLMFDYMTHSDSGIPVSKWHV